MYHDKIIQLYNIIIKLVSIRLAVLSSIWRYTSHSSCFQSVSVVDIAAYLPEVDHQSLCSTITPYSTACLPVYLSFKSTIHMSLLFIYVKLCCPIYLAVY